MCVFSAPCALDVGHLHALGEAQGALGSFFLLALEFGGLRGPRSITALCHPHNSPLFPSRAPASLQLISAPQTVVTTHHIMTQSKRGRLCPPLRHPPPGPCEVATFTFRAQIGPARCHQAEMQGQQLFPVQASTSLSASLCLTPSCCHFLTPSCTSSLHSLPRGLT